MSFHERLTHIMNERGIGVRELARSAQLCPTTISHLGQTGRNPSLRTVQSVLRALPDVDARWLLGVDKSP